MKKTLLCMLATLMLTMGSVSCSNDDNSDLENVQKDLNDLPTAIKDVILENGMYPMWDSFSLTKGTWKGKTAYQYQSLLSSYICDFIYLEDGAIIHYKEGEVDWSKWKEVYDPFKWMNKEWNLKLYPDLSYEPKDINTLPEWLQEDIYRWRNNPESCTVLEGTWQGHHTYWFNHKGNPYLINFFYLEDGTKSYYKPEEVDWSKWKCIYDGE